MVNVLLSRALMLFCFNKAQLNCLLLGLAAINELHRFIPKTTNRCLEGAVSEAICDQIKAAVVQKAAGADCKKLKAVLLTVKGNKCGGWMRTKILNVVNLT